MFLKMESESDQSSKQSRSQTKTMKTLLKMQGGKILIINFYLNEMRLAAHRKGERRRKHLSEGGWKLKLLLLLRKKNAYYRRVVGRKRTSRQDDAPQKLCVEHCKQIFVNYAKGKLPSAHGREVVCACLYNFSSMKNNKLYGL